ncbi:hypothetical protein BVX97_02025 [bacterium E08(2017)]|nr:hypothetical protein BVX97_02025 [bacterium E08(2017)]
MASIFKAYDIRGVYGDTLDEKLAKNIGRAFVTFLKCKKVVVGRDMRPHSGPLFDALAEGITMQGADIVDLGLCTSPMSYYANGTLGADAGIMITASHNPGEWNGFKLSREKAIPISGVTGIADIEKIILDEAYDAPAETPGTISKQGVIDEYCAHVREMADLARPVKIVADMANAMGVLEAEAFDGIIEIDPLFNQLDGSFPNHEANPLDHETLVDLQKRVKESDCDFGIAFDGDADRCGFVDENGDIVPMDLITALVAEDLLSKEKGVIFYDLRSSWAVKEIIEENGGTPMMSRVGHAFIKEQMRDNNAIFAGELSGHYYFRDNFFTESSSMAAICVANIVSKSDKPLSELVKPIKKYFASGEINSTVKDTGVIFERLKKDYSDGNVFELDGVSVEYDEWWFNVRASNTEPLMRLNVEAKTQELMEQKRDEVLAFIRS